MLELIINNKKYMFEKNITVLQACEQAGVTVPRFCYHEKLSVAGNCRMCLVEIEKSPKPVASCAMPISNGMVIFTETPLVKKAREAVLEFLLINHPLDCPICDQGGECDLQDLTLNYGSDRGRFFELKHGVEDKECGPLIKTIMTRCIHCTRCVRFLSEVAGLEVFGALGRGELMEIGTYLNKYLKTEISGNLIDLCPVGALTSKPYAFLARNWELKKIETVDFQDSFGSNTVVHVRNFLNTTTFNKAKELNGDQILRVVPKLNNSLNENWISDKTRFSFDGNFNFRNSKIEFKSINKYEIFKDWNLEVLNTLNEQILKNPKTVLGFLGSSVSVEELYFFYQFLTLFKQSGLFINKKPYYFNKDLPSFYQFNSNFSNVENSDLILLVGTNLRFECSMLNLKIRKHFFNKEVPVYLIGTNLNFNYPINHLGNSTKILYKIAEGTHAFCQKLRFYKNPLIIIGSEIGFRKDSQALQNLIRYISKKSFLQLKNFCGLNIIHASVGLAQLCELGLSSSQDSLISNNFLRKNKNLTVDAIISQNVDYEKKNFSSLNFKGALGEIFLNTHMSISNTFKNSYFNLPVTSLYERDSFLINSEGRVQKGFKATTPLKIARNSEDVLRSVLLLNNNLNKNKILFTTKFLFLDAPFLKKTSGLRNSFFFNFLNLKELRCKVNFEVFNPIISNFYMTDNLSLNSKTMAECTLFLKDKTNFN